MELYRYGKNKRRTKTTNGIVFLAAILNLCSFSTGTRIDEIFPKQGSIAGETRLTITGSGFSQDTLNEGNEVQLVSDRAAYQCPVHKDGTTEDIIMCYTPANMPQGYYWARVKVDGNDIPDNQHCGSAGSSKCRFSVTWSATPTITSVEPTSGPPGSILTIRGTVFTSRYGSNVDESTNGKTERILRVYAASNECELKHDNDVLYGIQLDNDGSSNNGYLKCKVRGTFVGNHNASFIIEGAYGRSLRDSSALHVYTNDQVALFQTYAEVTSITPNQGSISGGTIITIAGFNFDERETKAKTVVKIEGTDCEVQSVNTSEIICKVAAKPSTITNSYTGNRGMLWESWNTTFKSFNNIDDVATLNSSAADYASSHVDQAYFLEESWDNYVSRMSGYFVPPKTGNYSFHIMADDGATLWFSNTSNPQDKAKIAYARSYTTKYDKFPEQGSSIMTLEAGRSYYMEIHHLEGSVGAYAKVAARLYDTKFTNQTTGKATPETQVVKITSTIVKEIHNVTLRGLSPTVTAVNEVQEVVVTENSGGLSTATYRLGLNGAYTVPLTTASTDLEIGEALKSLPLFHKDESVSVSSTVASSGVGSVITVTFASERGDFPLLTYTTKRGSGGETLGVTVTEKTKGVPSGKYFTLQIGGVPSPLIKSDATESEVESSLNEIFGARCPKTLASPAGSRVHYTFEGSLPSGVGGTKYTKTDAFCGRAVVLNPRFLYRDDEGGTALGQSMSTLCFAYKGQIQNRTRLTYSYEDINGQEVTEGATFDVAYKSSNDWAYGCFDMLSSISAHRTDGSNFILKRVEVYRVDVEVYFDEVYLGRSTPVSDPDNVNLLRMQPAKLNSFVIQSVSVKKYTPTNGDTVFEVTFSPEDCGCSFPKFSAISGQVKSGASISVSRPQQASCAIGGTFGLSFKGTSVSGLIPSMTGEEMKDVLKAIPQMGEVYIFKHGECDGEIKFSITFLSNPGNQESIVASSQLTGEGVSIAVETVTDGSVWFDPIQGDMLRMIHDKPQVSVFINNVPTKCSGDCTFEWTALVTPTITGVSPTSGNPGVTEITITGTGFDSSHGNNNVTIGNTACVTKSATTTQIVCDVGDGPKGTYPVEVIVTGTGNAQNDGNNVTFTYNFQISTVTPTTCSVGGGCDVTLTGFGLAADDVVAIGNSNNTCRTKSRSTTQIVCTVPPSSTTAAQDILVAHRDGTTTTYGGSQFTYISSGIPTVSSINPSVSGVQGGDPLTITGTNFDTTGTLTICNTVVTPTTFTTTQVVATLPPNAAGSCEVQLSSSTGVAVDGSNQVPSIEYDLKIQNVYPRRGSLYGGTRLTVTGQGFSTNTSATTVKVGSHDCVIDMVTANLIICTIADTAAVQLVDNTGVHYEFGEGYEWNPNNVRVYVGDIVHWSWTYPSWVAGMTPRLTQVSCSNMTNEVAGGFRSGTVGTKTGVFEHRFTAAGTYCFWSGHVDIYKTTQFSGVVEVMDRASTVESVSVRVGGYEAIHDINSGVADPVDTSPCPMTLNTVSGCSDAAPSGGDPTKFTFAFWSCSSPTVTSVSPNSGTTNTVITISGSGFSGTNCLNEVKFGSNACIVSTATDTEIQCSIDPSTSPPIGVLEEVSYRLQNLGNALVPIADRSARSFGLSPLVTDLTPGRGSKAGGTRVVVGGTGFPSSVNDVQVTIGGYSVNVVDVSYEALTLETKASAGGDKALDVQVKMPSGQYSPATCTIVCQYVFDPSVTPALDSVTPTSLSGASTTLTLSGSNFGSATTTSDLTVTVGGESCAPTVVTDTSIECTVSNVPAGSNSVVVNFAEFGLAEGIVTVSGDAAISSLSPTEGSTNGGTSLTISGNGFVSGSTTVDVDGSPCVVDSVTLSQVVCTTPTHAAGGVMVTVTSNGQSYTQQSFTYSSAATPDITSVSPTVGSAGTTLVLTGTNFGATNAENSVLIDGTVCTVTSSSTTSVSCTLAAKAVGTYSVLLKVSGKGDSNTDRTFEYQLAVSAVNPSSGGTSGGQTVTVTGSGFDSTTTVSVCGVTCPADSTATQTSSQYICVTPDSGSSLTQSCNVAVTQNGVTQTLTSGYTYDASLTPEITGVSPARGGTGGGTSLTITGSGFGNVPGDVTVTLDGNSCTITSTTDTQVICTTGAAPSTVRTKVRLEKSGNGIAKQTSADFHYIDVWSSSATWGGLPPPVDGDLVVIEKNHSILLDTNTAKLKMLLIKGGELIFDEQDLTLDAENILVTEGGLFQIGTEAEPFQHKATVFLRGHHRTKELPIYGTKNLGIREGRLELHGKYVPITWTRLASTAAAGSNVIVLQDEVTWEVGDHVAIATTNHRHSQIENEERVIASIAGDKKTITLTQALTYEHLGVSETFDGVTLDFRAEVGLLTHNVKVEGYSDPQWHDVIEACPDGFDTGEFATQTCFQGRFGEEIGSDQFGAHILIHAPRPNEGLAVAHIEYIEVKHAGQAFRLGRYPIHFHLLGDMTGSYVRGCSIHDTFNRAVNIHGTHNVVVEHTVIYDIMGGAFFLEDGIETGNTFQYNLAVFVHMSSSLLNDDVTPAAFWATNPNNTYQHNTAAGGTHFGFWYRMHQHPDGPSATNTICPRNLELGKFYNNTVHSQGWFGLWIFETYTPRLGSGCGSTTTTPAVFQNIFVWNCEKGVEFVNSGALQLHDSYLVNNKLAGFEVKLKIEGPDYTDDGLMMKNTMVVGHANSLTRTQQGCTRSAVVIPYGFGFVVADSTFVNFDESSCAVFAWTRITGTCSTNCGGFTSLTKGLRFVNADNKGVYAWTFEGQIKDSDGTLIGETGDATSIASNVGKTVITCANVLPPSCVSFPKFSRGQSACACPSGMRFHRFGFNNPSPKALEFKNIILTTQYGSTTMPWKKKSITHPNGWHTVNVDGETTELEFENADHITNVSFTGIHYEFDSGDYVVMKHNIAQKPDRFMVDGSTHINESLNGLDPSTSCSTGDWEYDSANSKIAYSICGAQASGRKKRGSPPITNSATAKSLVFRAYKCYFKDCIPPPDPNTLPPPNRPSEPQLWSNTSLWNTSATGAIENNGGGLYGLPQDGDSVTIVKDTWTMADVALPNMHTLLLYGTLELDSANGTRDFVLNCTYIVIMGGRLVIGTPTEPFLSNAQIILQGDHSTPPFSVNSGATLGSKAIGVFGGLDLHGKDVGVTWTTLSVTANAGDSQITLSEAVEWEVGNEIVVTPTGYRPWETETFKITAVSIGKTVLTLNDTLQYRHIAHTETGNGWTMEMRAEVGLLTRNIKIQGADYDKLYEESFGARVLVSRAMEGSDQYIGYARISNVEFYRTSQEGYVESYDPRYSVAFVDSGTVTAIKPSYVKKCAFHHGFGPAVGVYGANKLPVEDNVAHGTVWWCMQSNSDNTQFRRNLCTLVQWEGSYQDRAEPLNVRYNGAFSALEATNLVFEGNHVAGTERVGFALPPESCQTTPANPYCGNVAHTALIGLAVLPIDKFSLAENCLKYSNFTLWKCSDFGYYVNTGLNQVVDSMKLADNGNNVFSFVSGPAALSHQYADKTTTLRNSFIVGRSSSFDCSTDRVDSTDQNIILSANSRPCERGRNVGVVMTTFSSGSNSAPKKPFCGIKSYQAIKGQSYIRDVTFSKFQDQCGTSDKALVPPQSNDDGIHPIEVSGVTFIDTPNDNKYRNGRANVGAINSADCVDMACDGLLKVLVDDTDGSFLGSPGSVISQSEFEYNGDRRRGLGDYRIPKEMLTRLDGTRIPYRTLAPYQGITRSSSTVYQSAWQAYEVHDLQYKMLVLESLDKDTETRRLSPIAVLADGYLDLINGPQDHGWCSGYTCRKRLSTFPIIVASGKEYLIHYTSTSPQDTRFMLLNSNSSHAVRLSIWYAHPNRLDMYVDGVYVLPKNGRMEGPTNDKKLILDPPPQSDPNFYMPDIATDAAGANFYNRNSGIFTFLLKGGNSEYVIKTDKTIIVSHQFPPMTVDEFFGQNIVQNLAAFLNIPASKVRVTDVIPENQSAGKRRRRATGSDVIVGALVEVGNTPSPDINGTVSGDLSSAEIDAAAIQISNEIQLGNYSATVNASLATTYSIALPPADTDTVEWANTNTESPYTVLYQVDSMRFNPAIVPLHEGSPFSTQPKVQILDANGNPVKNQSPWQLTASIRAGTGNPNAQLLGNTTVTFVDGWANFSNMYITHFGTDYIIDFNITDPVEGENVTLASDPITIQGRPITAAIRSRTTDVVEKSYVTAVIELRDSVTSEVISDIAWRGHTWTANATLGMPELYNGTLEGSLEVTFDPTTGIAEFYSMNITNLGAYVIKFHIKSNPPDYDFYLEELFTVKALSHIGMVIEEQKDIVVKFEADYNSVVGTANNKYFAAMMGNYLSNMYQDIITSSITVAPGSIVVTFQVGGSTININATSYALCSSIQNTITFNFNGNSLTLANYMTVGGVTYYGVLCGSMDDDSSDPSSSSILTIVLVVVLVLVAILLGIIAFGVWRFKVKPKTKTWDSKDPSYLGNAADVEEILWRERSFMSISSNAGKPQAPVATLMVYDKKPLTPSPRGSPRVSPHPWSKGYWQ